MMQRNKSIKILCVISGLGRQVYENCVLLGYYAASTDVSRQPIGPIFKDWLFKMEQICYPETSIRNYNYLLRNNPEERNYPIKTLVKWRKTKN